MPLSPFSIWTDPNHTRYFLLPDSLALPPGPFAIRAPLGKQQSVEPESLRPYELTEQQAKVWVASEISGILEAIPKEPANAGEKIVAAAHLIRQLPELIRLSQDSHALHQARESGAMLDRLLTTVGIETHSVFSQFPDRIAEIQRDSTIQSKQRQISAELRQIGEKIEIPSLRRFLEKISGSIDKNSEHN